ncbi:P-loop containing nucleoside triphosphate hydrolase protein [Trichoderma aethiopicum]
MSESTMDRTAEAIPATPEAQKNAAGEKKAGKAPKVATKVDDAALMLWSLSPFMSMGTVMPSDKFRIHVRFPREGCTYTFEDASMPVSDRFPDARGREKGFTVIRASLADQARVTVYGFGMPFANANDPEVQGWLNENKPITDGLTLLDVIRQRTFYFVVRLYVAVAATRFSIDTMPPFAYPYGTDQGWNVSRFKELIKANKGGQFLAAYSHDDDNHHMTAVNQSNVQDAMWLDDAAIKIAATKFPAYFVRPDSGAPTADTDRFFVVVAMRKGFREEHDAVWHRLTGSKTFLLYLYDNPDGTEPDAKWECKIVNRPAIKRHETAMHELVLLVRRPKRADMNPNYVVKDFGDREEADDALKQGIEHWHHVSLCLDAGLKDCKRRVEAVSLFHPLAEPSNPFRWGLPDPTMPARRQQALKDEEKANLALVMAQLRDRMELHRALVRGNGFYDWMTKKDGTGSIFDATSSLSLADTDVTCRRLPCVNFLEFGDTVRADAIVNEALPIDRARFRAYLSNRPLGLGIIAAGPHTGLKTAAAAATAAMVERYGRVLCSAPVDAHLDKFAAYLDTRTRAMTEACNRSREQSGPNRYRHRLVIRAYHLDDEVDAFNALLRDPTLGNRAAPEEWGHTSQWKLHLSLAFWFLAVLGSPAVRELHPDDSRDLWDLRHQIDSTEPELERLRDVATGVTTWERYEQEGLVPNKTIELYLLRLLPYVNMLCVTPAESEDIAIYRAWKTRVARGIVVDAATMNRADLYCVWGNTFLPCFLFGNPGRSALTKDNDGNFLNRFASSGSISALLFLQATCIPVYRLTTQLRMGNGLFDMISGIVYKGVRHVYASSCNVANASFEVGRALENYIQEKYPSKSPDQVRIALDFLVDLLKAKPTIQTSQITIIAPYAANVDLINYMLRKPLYKAALESIPPPSTADSFQGQENDIVIVQLLYVMLTRHRCGLVVDKAKGEDKGKDKSKGKGKGKAKADVKSVPVEGSNGEIYCTRTTALRQVHEEFHNSGRVLVIPVNKKQKAAETAETAAAAKTTENAEVPKVAETVEVVEVVEAGPAPSE